MSDFVFSAAKQNDKPLLYCCLKGLPVIRSRYHHLWSWKPPTSALSPVSYSLGFRRFSLLVSIYRPVMERSRVSFQLLARAKLAQASKTDLLVAFLGDLAFI